MVIDHVGLLWGIPWLRLLGRLSFPLFAYQVVISFLSTRSVRQYMTRLLLFAIISQPIFSMIRPGVPNVLFLFIVAVFVLWVWENTCASALSGPYSYMAFTLCAVFASWLLIYFQVDYGVYGLLLIWLIRVTQGSERLIKFSTYITLTVLSCVFGFVSSDQLIGVLPLLLPLYRLRRVHCWKYSFYMFYPAHILILIALKTISARPQSFNLIF